MRYLQILVPIAAIALTALAYQTWGWVGVLAAVGGLLMWLLLHFTRMMHVLKRASEQPVGYVASAVMLNAKLKAGMGLLQVLALTRSLGEQQSVKGEQPEIFRWTDGSKSQVTCELQGGKLVRWVLTRPDTNELEAKCQTQRSEGLAASRQVAP